MFKVEGTVQCQILEFIYSNECIFGNKSLGIAFSVVCCGSACLVKNSEFVHIEMTETGFSISEKKTQIRSK